jgi:hypothetical protein
MFGILSLKSLKTQVLFSNVASEYEPFEAKLIVPLSSGTTNLSAGVNVWACAFGTMFEITNNGIDKSSNRVRAIVLRVTFKSVA